MPPLDESPATFKASAAFHDWLNRQAGSMDISKSKLIRAAIKLAVPTLKANPYLIDVIDNGPIPKNGDKPFIDGQVTKNGDGEQ